MSHFLLSIYHDPGVQESNAAYASEEAMQEAFARVNQFNEELKARNHWVYACGLTEPGQARRVTPGGDTADGPAVRGDRHLGGFWVVDADDWDTAMGLAALGAAACGQPVEVRAMQ